MPDFRTAAILPCGSKRLGYALPTSDDDTITLLFPTPEMLVWPGKEKEMGFVDAMRISNDKSRYFIHDFVKLLAGGSVQKFVAICDTPIQTTPKWNNIANLKDMFVSERMRNSAIGHMYQAAEKTLYTSPEERWKEVAMSLAVAKAFEDYVEGFLTLPRETDGLLLNIRNGRYPPEEALHLVHRQTERLNKLNLPKEPDYKGITHCLKLIYQDAGR